MPEGNEVHRFRDRQVATFAGRTVHADSPSGQFPDAALLDGRKLRGIIAHGKHLGYDFGRDLILHVHLGRFGDFTEGTMPLIEPKGALRLRMWTKSDWLELRGPSDCSIYDQKKWERLMARLGPDPLEKGADPKPAFATIAERKTPIGMLLMDQSVFSGIGNIYRAELLYRVKQNPFAAGKDTSEQTLKALWKDALKLMRDGMVDRRIVTTRPKDRPHPNGTAKHDETHYVYRRHGKPCLVCKTTIRRVQMAGRTLYWCPTCQPDQSGAERLFLAKVRRKPDVRF
jgi:endonuclease-8